MKMTPDDRFHDFSFVTKFVSDKFHGTEIKREGSMVGRLMIVLLTALLSKGLPSTPVLGSDDLRGVKGIQTFQGSTAARAFLANRAEQREATLLRVREWAKSAP